jgi:hypothetical protein
VGLLEAGLLGEAKAGQPARLDTIQQKLAQVVLQSTEFHE